LTTLALAVPKIFHRVQNSKVGYVTLTTPLLGTVCRRQAGTWYDKSTHQIWSAYLHWLRKYEMCCKT